MAAKEKEGCAFFLLLLELGAGLIGMPFSDDELDSVLSEVGWGLMAWEALPEAMCGPNEARARVELIEGDSAVIGVSERGWKCHLLSMSDPTKDPALKVEDQERLFESAEQLLAALSPAFEQRRIKLLTEKLHDIAAARSWDDCKQQKEGQEAA